MVLTTGRVRLDLWYKALTVHLTIFVSTSDFEDGRIESRRRAKYLLRLSHLFFFVLNFLFTEQSFVIFWIN